MNKNNLKSCERCDVTEEKAILIAFPFATYYKGEAMNNEFIGKDESAICLSCIKEVEETTEEENDETEVTSK